MLPESTVQSYLNESCFRFSRRNFGGALLERVWKLEENLYPFVELVSGVLSDDPLFLILNSYTTGLAPSVVTYILETLVSKRFPPADLPLDKLGAVVHNPADGGPLQPRGFGVLTGPLNARGS